MDKLIAGMFIGAITSFAFSWGSRPPRDIKVYSVQPDDSYCQPREPWCDGKHGLVRKQDKEVIDFQKGWIAMSPEDFTRVIETCPRE